jgi:CheY-like chemotaxis protein
MLLADDSITIQKVVDLTFADEGMQVTTVSNGEQAIQKLEEIAPDIVLADVFMPGRNGYEVCEHIKGDERFRHIPVMLLVGSFEPFDEAEARRVGADDFLTKPFQSIRQLVSKVGALLSGHEDEATTKELTLPAEATRAEGRPPAAKPTELSMADTAPLPAHMREAAAGTGHEDAAGHASLDDEMIETKSASSFSSSSGGNAAAAFDADRQMQPTAPLKAEEFKEVKINPIDEIMSSRLQETLQNFSFELSEPTPALSQPAPAPSMAQAAAADDALLDLGDIELGAAAAEADDFILDLQDEAPAAPPPSDAAQTPPADDGMTAATLLDFQEEMTEAAPQVEEFAEAQAEVEEQRAQLAPVDETEREQVAEPQAALHEQLAPTIRLFDPPRAETTTESVDREETGEAASPPMGASHQISLEQLSPEVIDAIARRAVEQLSERVVQEIAWEVVPQLAEPLLKRRLEEETNQ